MGCAVEGGGDTVVARIIPGKPGVVEIAKIDGDNGRLSLDPASNCIGIAATETLKLIGHTTCGVSLTLHKVHPANQSPAAADATTETAAR
jgi:homoserine kinase